MRCLAARINYKTLIVICVLFTLVTVLLWNRCSNGQAGSFLRGGGGVGGFRAEGPEKRAAPSESIAGREGDGGPAAGRAQSEEASPQEQQKAPPVVAVGGGSRGNKAPGLRYEEIDCLINEEHTIKGRREGAEVFLPFSWVEKYFDVYGKVAQYDGYDRFEFSHSYSKVYAQRGPYHPDGVFMSFEGYNVEVRDRVKCISGVEAADQSRVMQEQMTGAAMAMPADTNKAFKTEWEALELTDHQWALEDVEEELMAKDLRFEGMFKEELQTSMF